MKLINELRTTHVNGDKINSNRKYCNDTCRFAYANAKRKKLISFAKETQYVAEIIPLSVDSPVSSEDESISLDEHFEVVDKLEARIDKYIIAINEANRGNQLLRDYIEEKA